MRSTVLLLLLPLLASCVVPTTEAIVGVWTNDDDSARQITLEDDTSYEIVMDDEVLQTGTYEVADETLVVIDGEEVTRDGVLVWTVGFDSSGVAAGSQFGDPIYQLTSSTMVLRSSSAESGRRTWSRVE
ncbi:MAG: hypothetical protein GY898_28185 [Proteobacteria bacterium]|nr:hypothetical protein [Pseudomonadota bacterium]